MLYRWIVYLHIASVLAFVGIHGLSAWTGWLIKKERDTARIGWMLSISQGTTNLMLLSLAFVLATGVLAGFMGGWWGKRWIWAAIAVFVALMAAMGIFAQDFRKLREAAGLPYPGRKKELPPSAAATSDVIVAAASATRAGLITAVGVVGLLIILWLMLFKPF